mmetsp:Transcript_14356/g.14555  ORF Transcript_14356/g.14555 Transcript_14356/m.14555 type:complete len:167 (+) Transcript_14356:67-567(+)
MIWPLLPSNNLYRTKPGSEIITGSSEHIIDTRTTILPTKQIRFLERTSTVTVCVIFTFTPRSYVGPALGTNQHQNPAFHTPRHVIHHGSASVIVIVVGGLAEDAATHGMRVVSVSVSMCVGTGGCGSGIGHPEHGIGSAWVKHEILSSKEALGFGNCVVRECLIRS